MNSNTSSSSSSGSVDSDDEFDQQIHGILELAKEAVTLIQATTTSSEGEHTKKSGRGKRTAYAGLLWRKPDLRIGYV